MTTADNAVYTAAATSYTLSLNELSAWPNIIAMQANTGLSSTYNDAACLTFANWTFLFTMNKVAKETIPGCWNIYDNTPVYSLITNTDLQKWMNDLFAQLIKLQVPAYKVPYYEIFTSFTIDSLLSLTQGLNPENIAGWGNLITTTLATWGNYAPPNLENLNSKPASGWSNPGELQSAISVLWTDQSNALKTLAGLNELTSEQCIYLMYLLPSLATGNADQQKNVQKVVSAPCNSMELPNSTFYTSLVYYNLMLLADPLGNYVQPNPQIQVIVNSLLPNITGTDPGSVAMKAALSVQAKILLVSANYPMVDPYNPAIGFNTRQSDMLAAINTSWAQMQTS